MPSPVNLARSRRAGAKPASRYVCGASTMLLKGHWHASLRGQRRFARHDDPDLRPRTGPGFQIDPASQTIGHDVVDDVQSQPGAALVAPGREEWIEHLTPDFRAHAAAVV